MTQENYTPSPAKGALALAILAALLFVAGGNLREKPKPVQQETAPQSEELVLVYNSDVGFSHMLGASPCPQQAGAISIGTLARTRSKLTELEVKGDLAPLVKVAPLAPSWEGVRITIMATYTCEVRDRGIYNGTIEATLRELESGREKHVSIPMSGVIH